MDLSKYNLKRDFKSTAEPKGEIEKSKKKLDFCSAKTRRISFAL